MSSQTPRTAHVDTSDLNIRPSQLKQNMLLNHFEQRDHNPHYRPTRPPSLQSRPTPISSPAASRASHRSQQTFKPFDTSGSESMLHPSPPSSQPPSIPGSQSQSHSIAQQTATSADASDYSDVGDYAADTDFYVPGVNDDGEPSSQQPNLMYRASAPVNTPFVSLNEQQNEQPEGGKRASRRKEGATRAMPRILSTPMPIRTSRSSRRPARVEEDHTSGPDPFDVGNTTEYLDEPEGGNNTTVGAAEKNAAVVDEEDGEGVEYGEEEEEDDAEDDEDDEEDETEDEGPVGMVRQHSNFSRLSAQSWLTVDSAQDVHVGSDVVDDPKSRSNVAASAGPTSSASAGGYAATGTGPRSDAGTGTGSEPRKAASNASDVPNSALFLNRRFSGVTDHDPATLFGVDVDGDAIDRIQMKRVEDMSVLECCVLLQAGASALKRKSFRRCATRRMWLGPECDRLYWKSKKRGMETDEVKLQRVAKLRSVDREVIIEFTEGYRISLILDTRDEAGLWVRALSCLIPLQARIQERLGVTPPEKDREDYTLSDDVFDGTPLRDMMAVNSYVVLCCAKGHQQSFGYKLAFSRSDAQFYAVRYVPRRISPLLLRSPEEIAVLKRLSHPNVVKYHECLVDSEHGGSYVVFEHVARGTLMDSYSSNGVNSGNRHEDGADWFSSNSNNVTLRNSTTSSASRSREGRRTLSEADARDIMCDILSALEYLHTLRIAHGDIRPDNLLRAVDGSVKVNAIGCITHDFTEVRNMGALVKARLNGAPCWFLAPEQCWLCDKAPEAHAKSYSMDVWAVGVVLYYLLFGFVPFKGEDDASVQASICTHRLKFPRKPQTSAKVRSLLKGILDEKDPKTRIALNELRRHPWFFDDLTGTGASSGGSGGGGGGGYGHSQGYGSDASGMYNPRNEPPPRLIVTPAEVNSAVQMARVRVGSRRA